MGSTYPKIELHVHLEGTIKPATLREIAKRNDRSIPRGIDEHKFRDFGHFIDLFQERLQVLCRFDDFRRAVVEYAGEAASHGAVYIEAIFVPGLWRGLDQDEVFSGCCDGAEEARELHGVEVRLTPDIPAVYTPEEADKVARYAVRYHERGVVGLGLAGASDADAMRRFARAFAIARDGGLGAVPHAGEVDGAASVRAALDVLHADRVRHGIRAANDPALVRELAARGTVLDICPISNLRTHVVSSIDLHPLPGLVAAGVRCSVSTDDPAMFSTNLSDEYDLATSLDLDPRLFYDAGVAGALCDEPTRDRLNVIGDTYDWA